MHGYRSADQIIAVRRHEGATIPAGRRIDYCFLSPALAARVRSCWVDMEAQGSDHQPLWVEIDF